MRLRKYALLSDRNLEIQCNRRVSITDSLGFPYKLEASNFRAGGQSLLQSNVMRVLHACSSPALVVEAPGRRVVFANPAANALFGLSEIRQWPLVGELITGWDVSKASFPASIRSKAGRWSPCNISLIPLSGEDRDLDVVLISEHSLEHDLEEAKQRLQFVIDMLPQAICLFDHDDRFVLWNKKYGELYTDIAQHLRPGILFEDILRISLASGEMSEIADDEELWLKQRLEKFRQPASQEEQQLRDGGWLRHDDHPRRRSAVLYVSVHAADSDDRS